MPGHLEPGHRAAGRYRLARELGRGALSVVWRAVDPTLQRQVALRFFDPALDRDVLAERAAQAASLNHPRIVRIFDTGTDAGQFFTVAELMPGSLAWARLPLPPPEVVRIGLEVCEALGHAHARGVVHGSLHRGNVLLSEQGVKVADFGLGEGALGSQRLQPSADLRQLGELLYLLATGRPRGRRGADGHPLADRPRGFARVVSALAEGRYPNAQAALADLRSLLRPRPRSRRGAIGWVAAAVVGMAAVGAWTVTRIQTASDTSPTPPPRLAGNPYPVASVADFDPLGDGQENPRGAALAADGDPATAWTTEHYSSAFPAVKAGVGLVVDLGRPRLVGAVRVVLATPGCSFDIRFSKVRAARPEAWQTVARAAAAEATKVLAVPATASRWWLVWITRLVRSDSRFVCAVAEAAFYPP